MRCGDWRQLSETDKEDAYRRFTRGEFHGQHAFWNVPIDGWSSRLHHRELRAHFNSLLYQGHQENLGSPRLRRRSVSAIKPTPMGAEDMESDRKRLEVNARQAASRRRKSFESGDTVTQALKAANNPEMPLAENFYSLEQIQSELSSLPLFRGQEANISAVGGVDNSLKLVLTNAFEEFRGEIASEHRASIDLMSDELASAQSVAVDAQQKVTETEERASSTCKKAKVSVDSAISELAKLRAENETLKERLRAASSEEGAIGNFVRHLLEAQGDPAKRTSQCARLLQTIAPVGSNSFRRQVKAELIEYVSSFRDSSTGHANQALCHRIALGMKAMRTGLEDLLPNVSGHGRFVDPVCGTLRPFNLAATLASMSTSDEAIEVYPFLLILFL